MHVMMDGGDGCLPHADILSAVQLQFFIASGNQAPYWLDGKHVVFGKVHLLPLRPNSRNVGMHRWVYHRTVRCSALMAVRCGVAATQHCPLSRHKHNV